MPSNRKLKDNKCLVCQNEIPKDRMKLSVTCKRDCSRIYMRIQRYVRNRIVNKYISKSKKIKVMESDKC